MNNQTLRWALFLPLRSQDQRERASWIEETLRSLWEHGAIFATAGWEEVTTWDEALAAPATAHTISLGPDQAGLNPEPLGACIARMATTRTSSVMIYGAEISMSLGFDFAIHPESNPEDAALVTDPVKRAGVNQFWDRLQIQSSTPMGEDAVEQAKRASQDSPERDTANMYPHAYLGQYAEYWRWCVLLCELTQPIFGMGYREDMLSRRGLEEHSFYYMNGGQELTGRRLPELGALFTRTPARYIAVDFAPEIQRQVIEEAKQASPVPPTIQFLRTGGTLVLPGHPIFTPEAERAFTIIRQAELILRRLESLGVRLDPAATDEDGRNAAMATNPATQAEGRVLAERARALLQRARKLFLSVGETTKAASVDQSLQRVFWTEERLGIGPS